MNTIEELRKKLIKSAKEKVQQKFETKDVHIIKAVNLLEDVDSVSNLLTEQLIEWYSFHFPELLKYTKDTEYLQLVHAIGQREKFTAGNVKKIVLESKAVEKIVKSAKNSMGSTTNQEDMKQIQSIALNCYSLQQERERLTKYLETQMTREMPNFTELAGAVIGAKLLAKAGGKKKLAFLPSSTIQVIGAEKALFLHFKKGTKGPKYGYLFQHPLIKSALQSNKGRLARSLAAKLSIAARKDYFGNTSNVDNLKKEIEERAKELQAKTDPDKKGTPSNPKFKTAPIKRERNDERRDNYPRKSSYQKRTSNRDSYPKRTSSSNSYPKRTSSRDSYPKRTSYSSTRNSPEKRTPYSSGRSPTTKTYSQKGDYKKRNSYPTTDKPYSPKGNSNSTNNTHSRPSTKSYSKPTTKSNTFKPKKSFSKQKSPAKNKTFSKRKPNKSKFKKR